MKPAFAAALLWLAGAAPAATALLPPAAFRDRFAAAIAGITHQPVVAIDDRTFRTKRADGTELTVSIDNVYAQYQADPAQIEGVIARYARVLLQPSDDGAPIDRLVMIVRPTDYLASSLPPGAATTQFLPGRPMAGDLSYFLAVDAPDTIRLAGPKDLARWQIDGAEAWRRATANIKPRVGPLRPTRLGSEDGPSGWGADSGLALSVLADPGICGPASPDGMAGQLVLAYARDLFLYAMPADHAVTDLFWRTAKQEIAAHRSMSATVLTCRAGRWIVVPIPG